MKRYGIPAFLVIAGALLLIIGGFLLLEPHAFFAENGVTLGDDPNLMSEIRAPAGLLIVSGTLMVLGAFVQSLASVGLGLAAMVYGSYGASRLVSIGLDGLPSQGILWATGLELVIGGLALVVLRLRQSRNGDPTWAPRLEG